MLNDSAKSILILKSSSQGLGPAEIFLKNRDWKIRATNDLKEAMVYLIKEQPQFVMISIDHPNPNVAKLPRILKQAFPICVIAFAEKNLPSSLNALAQSGTEYILYPPIAGPSFERLAHKYNRDMITKKPTSGGPITPGPFRAADGSFNIKGGSFVAGDLQHILTRFMNGEESSVEEAPSPVATTAAISASPAALVSTPAPASPAARRASKKAPEDLHSDPRAVKKDSIIFRGARLALETACETASDLNSKPIGAPSKVRCLVIESIKFSGYLITAMAAELFEENLMKTVRERLIRFLGENGETLGRGATMDLKIQPVPFEDWALEHAEFLRKSVHQGQDVALAFFPHNKINAEFLESQSADMLCLDIDELVCGNSVEFNLYIHLPLNDRYVLYTPRGSVFYHNQKQRLTSQGMAKVHIKKAEITDVQRYRAQNFLNEKIRAFEENEID